MKSLKLIALFFSVLLFSCTPDKKQNETSDMDDMADEKMEYNGSLYLQTNKEENHVIHYARMNDGTLKEVQSIATQGLGTNGFKPVTGEESAPDPLFSAYSVHLSPDKNMLFVANGGDSSVSSFLVGENGMLTFANNIKTSGGVANSLAYNPNSKVLSVSHSFGPDHIMQFKVSDSGQMEKMGTFYTVNTKKQTDRIPTMIAHSPDFKFLLTNIIFDARPKPGDNGPILTLANLEDKNALVVFPVNEDGSLGEAIFNDAGSIAPFTLRFLHGSNDTFVNTYAAGSGAGLSLLNEDGKVTNYSFSPIDLKQAPNGPSETCWVSLDKDNNYAYGANFGLGTVTSYEIIDNGIVVKNDGQALIEGKGFKALAQIPTSGPADNWMSNDNYFYQLYGNAGLLIAFKAENGNLTEIARYNVPVDSVQGMDGINN